MKEETNKDQRFPCPTEFLLALKDTLNVLEGKWKIHIMGSLLFGKKRFKQIEREVVGITPRMLSKELKDLEMNGIITRTVYDTIPVTVEYELTASGESFKGVMDVMIDWGINHRKKSFYRKEKELASLSSVN